MGRKRRMASLTFLLVLSMLVNSFSSVFTVYANEANTVSATKTARWIEPENEATVTFSINAGSTTIPKEQIKKTDIVLVLDRSGSMSGNKLSNVKTAAKNFVNGLLTNENLPHVRIAVVSYADESRTDQGLINNKQSLTGKIDGLNAGGGTNIQAGIKSARTILDGSSAQNKYIVLLSDGEPTYSYKGTSVNSNSTPLYNGNNNNTQSVKLIKTFNNTLMGDGSDYELSDSILVWNSNLKVYSIGDVRVTNHGLPTISEAYLTKSDGIKIFSIAFATGSGNAAYVMKNVASSLENYYTAGNSLEAINSVFTSIRETINETVVDGKGSIITDTIPEYFEFVPNSFLPNGNGVVISADGRTLTWTLGDLKEGQNVFSYRMRLKSNWKEILTPEGVAAGDYSGQNENGENQILANQEASLTYMDPQNVSRTHTFDNPTLPLATYGYQIRYEYDGVVDESETITGTAFTGDIIRIAQPEKTGYHKPTSRVNNTDITEHKQFLISTVEGHDNIALVSYNSKVYTVTFVNHDDTILKTQDVRHGDAATAPDTDPTKPEDAQFTYTFAGWDKTFTNVTENLTVKAQYEAKDRYYTVNFYTEEGGNLIGTQQVKYGDSAIAPDVPTKETTAEYTYTFAGWDKEFNHITSDLDVNGTFTAVKRQYTVVFKHAAFEGNRVLKTETVEYGASVEPPEIPTVVTGSGIQYTFTGWSDDGYSYVVKDVVTNAEYSAENMYTVRFHYGDDKKTSVLVVHGADATAPTDTQKSPTAESSYEFISWDKDYSNVESDLDVYAQYREIKNKYQVRFFKEDKTQIGETQMVEYGASAVEADRPGKDSDTEYDYEFDSWSTNAWQNVTGNVDAYATYRKITKRYTVTFRYKEADTPAGGEAVIGTSTVPYNTAAVAPPEPSKASTAQYSYAFIAWLDEEGNRADYRHVVKDMTVYASFQQVLRRYKITFLDDNHAVLKDTTEYDYGTKIADTAPAEPVKPPTPQKTYTFAGWLDKDNNKLDLSTAVLTEDVVYYASYTDSTNKHTVRFYQDDKTTLLHTVVVEHGGAVTAPGNPTKTSSGGYRYTFKAWLKEDGTAPNLSEITSDLNLYASYNATKNSSGPVPTYTPKYPTLTPTPTPEVTAVPTPSVEPTIPPESTDEQEMEEPLEEQEDDMDITSEEAEDEDAGAADTGNSKANTSGGSLPKTGTANEFVLYMLGFACILMGSSVFKVTRQRKA